MDEYETIKAARALLQGVKTIASEKTRANYIEKAHRLKRQAESMEGMGDFMDRLIACAKKTNKATTWFSRRAALAYSFRKLIEHMLSEQDKVQRALKAAQVSADDVAWHGWKDIVAKIGRMIERHERIQNEPAPALETRAPRHSKRKDMHGLPADWREQIVSRMSKYRIAVLIQAVTGCRPAELQRGVALSIQDGVLVAEIMGVKVKGNAGQPWRRLSWPVDSDVNLVAMLVSEVRKGLTVGTIQDEKAYAGAVRAAGMRAWPKRKKSLSPYCFRHQAAADMKASGVQDGDISAALGHCSDVAKSYYGNWRMGSARGVAPKGVAAARPVRVTQPSKHRRADSAQGHA